MKKFVAILLLLTLPLVLFNGCAKKQEAEQQVETEEIEQAPVDTTVTAPEAPPEGEAEEEEAPQEEEK
ncbi:hypothetical protein H8E88_08930 [candidate division KSB1 bacterium]|nr:hypothetical protein [candidate division KSB1 bacterium]MBL7092514.1 hypothetical protein [candidate division KSB1 bacterium]